MITGPHDPRFRRRHILGWSLAASLTILVMRAPANDPAGREARRRVAFDRLEANADAHPLATPENPSTSGRAAAALMKGKIVPVVVAPGATNPTTPTGVAITVDPPVSTVGVRLNVAGSGRLASLHNPTGPLPGTLEFAFATVTGEWTLPSNLSGQRRVVARGVNFDLGWGDFRSDPSGAEVRSTNLKSVTIPAASPLRRLPDNHLLVKAPGRAVFVLFAVVLAWVDHTTG
jgi:hypothetical protein